MFIVFSVILVFTSIAFGVPSLRRAGKVDLAPSCNGLGNGLIDSAQNFTLAVFNRAGPNVNNIGSPLVLANNGATSGATSETFATWASYSYNSWPNYSMQSGGLTANSDTHVRTIATAAANSSAIFFWTSSLQPDRQPARIFCSVPSNDVSGQHPYPYLAVNNRYDLFSLCNTSFGQWRVIYNVTAGVPSYDYEVNTCYPVLLNMLGNFSQIGQ